MSKRPCSFAGCSALVPLGAGLCDRHQQGSRPSSTARGYGTEWRDGDRKEHLARVPFCVECEREGETELATEVDHRAPLWWWQHQDHPVRPGGETFGAWLARTGGPETGNDPRNYQSLCRTHHSRKTARHDGSFGEVRSIPESFAWGALEVLKRNDSRTACRSRARRVFPGPEKKSGHE